MSGGRLVTVVGIGPDVEDAVGAVLVAAAAVPDDPVDDGWGVRSRAAGP